MKKARDHSRACCRQLAIAFLLGRQLLEPLSFYHLTVDFIRKLLHTSADEVFAADRARCLLQPADVG